MENWRKNSRKDIVMVDVDALVPKDHLLRKIENVMDYEWLYARLSPYYCADNGRPGADPVVLIKMVLLQHLYGIPSLRQTYREIQVNIAYRWFLGYSLLDEIPPFRNGKLCFLQAISSRGKRGNLCAYPEQGVESPNGRSQYDLYRRNPH